MSMTILFNSSRRPEQPGGTTVVASYSSTMRGPSRRGVGQGRTVDDLRFQRSDARAEVDIATVSVHGPVVVCGVSRHGAVQLTRGREAEIDDLGRLVLGLVSIGPVMLMVERGDEAREHSFV